MRFGMQLPAVTPLWAPKWDASQMRQAIRATAQAADRLGYDWLATAEHLLIPPDNTVYRGPWYDSLMPLAFIAGITERVKLHTSVLVAPYHSPVALAKQLATLDLLSGGRMIFGVGAGHLEAEFRAMSLPYEDRGRMTDEWLRLMRALWETDPVNFSGRWLSFEGMNFEPKPERRIPIWSGGHAPKNVRRAVEYGDGWNPALIRLPKARGLYDYLRTYQESRGVSRKIEWIMPLGNRIRAPMVKSQAAGDVHGPAYYERRNAEQAGDPDALLALISEQKEAGVDACTVQFVFSELSELIESMEWFAREVMAKAPGAGQLPEK